MSHRNSAVRTLVLGVSATLVTGALVAPGAGAADKPLAQSVGRFLDGSVGGNPIQQLADVKDARAVNPGTTSAQNPLDATLLGQLDVPLGNALKLPGGGVFKLGAVNQVAVAKSDGYSYGASGAVSNSGGVSLGGDDKDFPANATITLSDAALGSVTIPGLPSLPSPATAQHAAIAQAADAKQPALGGVSASIGAVSALAQTKSGGDPVTPQYQIAGLSLGLKSPALAALLQQLVAGGSALNSLLDPVLAALGAANITIPKSCTIKLTTLPTKITLDKGAVVIDPANAAITINLEALLKTLGADLNALPANTDLLAYVLGNLGKILSHGLENVINGLLDPIENQGAKCISDITKIKNIGPILGALLTALTGGQTKLENALNKIADQLSSAGASGLKSITDALAKVVAIGVNVESGPGKAANNSTYKFTSQLDPTPDQATPVVANQTLVRAIEIDLLGGQAAVLALGNAAAGPSSAAVTPPTSTNPVPTTTPPGTVIPTGVPAGRANLSTGTPVLPIVLLVLGLLMAAGGAVTWRFRGGRHAG